MEDMLFIQAEDELFGEDQLDCHTAKIFGAKYE
jgi:hypothetical protein